MSVWSKTKVEHRRQRPLVLVAGQTLSLWPELEMCQGEKETLTTSETVP